MANRKLLSPRQEKQPDLYTLVETDVLCSQDAGFN